MAKRVIVEDKLPEEIEFVAGVDVAYTKSYSIGATAVLDYASLTLIESRTVVQRTYFPYIPTLLSFREAAPIIHSLQKLTKRPDVILVDGHGLAHPYNCGLACHIGLVLQIPTIGVAKSNLTGNVVKEEPDMKDGLIINRKNEIIGASVITKKGSKPIYVSVGHKVSLQTAVRIVKQCIRDKRIVEPILRAHEAANIMKRNININSLHKKR
jgi:deoxyribonuclease V